MRLFKEFNPVSSKEWKQRIQMDLKGADYNETLISDVNGIQIKPFYHQDSSNYIKNTSEKKEFKISQKVFIDDEKIAGNIAAEAFERGVDTVYFIANKRFNIEQILQNLNYKEKEIVFRLNFLDEDFIQELGTLQKLNVKIDFDIIHNLAETGNWYFNENTDFKTAQRIVDQTKRLTVDTRLYQNAGANYIQQIAYGLAHANEYLNRTSVTTLNCIVAVGGDYFLEIAKLRALRYLLDKLVKEHEMDTQINITAHSSFRNKTIYDYNVNMLRTTTEAMSSIIGGADVVCNMAYDELYHKSNAFGERIARNQMIILKDESYFKEANKIADGAYYIEQLTYDLAGKALVLFKDIEKNGGFLAQLKKGTIQRKIEEEALKEQNRFDNSETILVGTNKFANQEDRMKNELELYPFVKKKVRKTTIKPIIAKRLSEKIEQERLEKE